MVITCSSDFAPIITIFSDAKVRQVGPYQLGTPCTVYHNLCLLPPKDVGLRKIHYNVMRHEDTMTSDEADALA
ncbi:MAG: hypothetical protein WCF06_08890, partial [Nitrososphaeraceae archaeon]